MPTAILQVSSSQTKGQAHTHISHVLAEGINIRILAPLIIPLAQAY